MRDRRPSLSIVVPVPDVPEPRPAIDLQDAATMIGLHPRTIRRLIENNQLEGYKPVSRRVCVYLDSIEKFQKSRLQLGQGVPANDGAPVPRQRRRTDHAQHRQACARLKRLGVL